MEMFKSRQKQEDNVDVTEDGGIVMRPKIDNSQFDKEYLNRHTKFKKEHVLNPELEKDVSGFNDSNMLLVSNSRKKAKFLFKTKFFSFF